MALEALEARDVLAEPIIEVALFWYLVKVLVRDQEGNRVVKNDRFGYRWRLITAGTLARLYRNEA